MIDLITKFVDKEKEIGPYITDKVNEYYKSDCFTRLDKRITDLGLSNDLRPASLRLNNWNSHVVFPIVKERSLLRRAITSANYRSSDTFTLVGTGSTPQDNAVNAELVLNLNMAHTFFKMLCLKPCIDTASKFGTAIIYTYWKADEDEKLKTVYDPTTGMYERQRIRSNRKNSWNVQIDLRDYFQNPSIANPDESDFQGHYKRLTLADLITMLDDDTYIRENLAKVIDDLKRGLSRKNKRLWQDKEIGQYEDDLIHFEGLIQIKGNEDGTQRYTCEMIGDTIIKLMVDNYDDDIRSYTVLNFDKRSEWYWGNSDSEYVVAHENFLNTFLSMSADNAMRSMQQYIFFAKDTINPADIANIHRNNGFIPVDVKNYNLSNLINPFQPGNINLANANFVTQMVNDSIQKMSTKVDLSRKSDQGGVQNNATATAANILAGQSDILEADILENFDFGVSDCGRKNLVMLQQFLSELFYVRPRPQDAERQLQKFQILGDFEYQINSTASKNKQGEMLRMQNLATWLLNIMANPIMQQAGYNVAPIVKDILQKADIPSVEDVLPNENAMMAAPGMVLSNPMIPAAMGGGMTPRQQIPQQQPMMQGAMA